MASDQRAIVLLSGGLDSTVALACAVRDYDVGKVLFFNYGQKAAVMEQEAAERIAAYFGLDLSVIPLPFFTQICTKPAIMGQPNGAGSDSTTAAQSWPTDAASVWVPNRNAVFISIAASFAEALRDEVVVVGFNAEEAREFPDNTAEFVQRANRMLGYSTLTGVSVVAPLAELNKTEILRLGLQLDAPLQDIYPCYAGGEQLCGRCRSCLRLKRAMASVTGLDAHRAEVLEELQARFAQ